MKSLHSEIQHINLRLRDIDHFKSGTILGIGFEQEIAKAEDDPYVDRFRAELRVQLNYTVDRSEEGRFFSKERAEESLIRYLYEPMIPVIHGALDALYNNDKDGVADALVNLRDYCYGRRSDD